jgi:LPXTG-site transpeptidase (sortase) family protein
MLKTKKTNKYKSLVILGSLLILLSLSVLSYKLIVNSIHQKQEDKGIEDFYKKEEINKNNPSQTVREEIDTNKQSTINYIAILKIPKINLEKGLVDKNSKYNNINYNIMIHNDSNLPDVEGGNVILVSHSGNASISYFKNLDKLTLDDLIYLDFNSKTYTYKIFNIYDVEKTGELSIKKELKDSTITLITCRHNTNKQIVIIGKLIAQY